MATVPNWHIKNISECDIGELIQTETGIGLLIRKGSESTPLIGYLRYSGKDHPVLDNGYGSVLSFGSEWVLEADYQELSWPRNHEVGLTPGSLLFTEEGPAICFGSSRRSDPIVISIADGKIKTDVAHHFAPVSSWRVWASPEHQRAGTRMNPMFEFIGDHAARN